MVANNFRTLYIHFIWITAQKRIKCKSFIYIKIKHHHQRRFSIWLCIPENTKTCFLHDIQSLFCVSASIHDYSNLFESLSLLNFGRPGLRFPSEGSHLNHFFGMLCGSILSTCPSHLSFLFFTSASMLLHLV